MSNLSLKIAVIDDHKLTHAGLNLLFDKQPDYNIVAQFNSGLDFLAYLATSTVDIVLLDLGLPDISGVNLLTELIGREDMTVIIVTGENKPNTFDYALKMGVRAIVSKSDPIETIVRAIDHARLGEIYMSPTISNQLKGYKAPDINLSPRQMGILHLLCEGHTNKEIGYRLKISAPTVTFHITEIRKKIGVKSNQQILSRARDLQLL